MNVLICSCSLCTSHSHPTCNVMHDICISRNPNTVMQLDSEKYLHRRQIGHPNPMEVSTSDMVSDSFLKIATQFWFVMHHTTKPQIVLTLQIHRDGHLSTLHIFNY